VRTPDGIAELVGYKTWSVLHTERGPRLMSGIKGFVVWEPAVPVLAHCFPLRDTHRAPEWSCSCGVYATKHPQNRRAFARVGGQVKLWGRVIEHEHGYRAEFAAPISFLWAGARVDLDALSAIYGVPILSGWSLAS